MTDLQKAVQALRDALQELEAATAPEPVKPWWDGANGRVYVHVFDDAGDDNNRLGKFYCAAPLMAKALLSYFDYNVSMDDEEEQMIAALKAAGVEVPE